MCTVRIITLPLLNSAQKLDLNPLSSLEMLDFMKNVRVSTSFLNTCGREFLMPVLLYRKLRKRSSTRKDSIGQNCSERTRL